MKFFFIAFVMVLLTAGCSSKRPEFAVAHRYALRGRVVSVNAKEQTASIDAAAVPGFMEAMTMDYPVQSKAEFNALRPGEKITATLNVSASNDEYNLTDVREESSGKK